MKVNGIPFLMTTSRHIKFVSAGKLDNTDNITILKHFKLVFVTYASRGFKVTIILTDNQFKSIRSEQADMSAIINIVSRDEHVPKVERYNQTIKDHVCSVYKILPFKHIPPIFVVELVYSQVFWRNMFAIKGGISATRSPSELICKVEFGEYVQTHEEPDNSMATRIIGAIATRPTGSS
jgi:hypothetical protein